VKVVVKNKSIYLNGGITMRSFKNIAVLIRTKRINHSKNYSQSDLSELLGYKNGQFISNVERGLCNVPLKMMRRISEVLEINQEEIKAAILKDHEATLANYFDRPVTPTKSAAKSEVA
jgi:transcriptional regulator with XRE-family HTH domain